MGRNCGHCINAEQLLAPQIQSGIIEKLDAKQAPEGKFRGFPAFEYKGKTSMGLPKSFEDLAAKLNFVQEKFVHGHYVDGGGIAPYLHDPITLEFKPTSVHENVVLRTVPVDCGDKLNDMTNKICKTQLPNSNDCKKCVDSVWKTFKQTTGCSDKDLIIGDYYNTCGGGSKPVPHTKTCPDGCPLDYCDESGVFKTYGQPCIDKSPGGLAECCRCASSDLSIPIGQCAQGCTDSGGECVPGTPPTPNKWTKQLYNLLIKSLVSNGVAAEMAPCIANGIVTKFPNPTNFAKFSSPNSLSPQDKATLLSITTACMENPKQILTPKFNASGELISSDNSGDNSGDNKKELQPWKIVLIVGGSILGVLFLLGIIMAVYESRKSLKRR